MRDIGARFYISLGCARAKPELRGLSGPPSSRLRRLGAAIPLSLGWSKPAKHIALMGSRFSVGVTACGIAVLCSGVRPAGAQLELPTTPFGPEVVGPVLLKEERAVAQGAESVRILVVGDAGVRDGGWGDESDRERKAVAARAREICSLDRCDLIVMLGDNLYEKGIRKRSVEEDEAALVEIVRSFLAEPDTPVYLVMGNHDWSPRIAKHATVDRQLTWIADTGAPDVRGDAHFYNFAAGPVGIWVLDTTPLVRKSTLARDPALLRWLDDMAEAEVAWKIVLAHHPMRSNGEHGNPGDYREPPLPFAIWPGKTYRTLLDTKIEGVADLHLGGHEHNLQFWAPTGASAAGALTASAVVGSAAKCTGPGKRLLNPAMQIEAYNYGFAVLEASSDSLSLEFHLVDGTGWDSWRVWRGLSGGWQIGTPSPYAVDRSCRSSDSCCPTPAPD